MKQATIKKYIKFLETVEDSQQGLFEYCKNHKNTCNYNTIRRVIHDIKTKNQEETEDIKTLLALYEKVTYKNIKENIDTDDIAETSYIRDESGHIQYYEYKIFRKKKVPLSGRLTREEMNTIHRLYSYYGDALTQRVISRHFVDLSLIDFKRILRAFNITKASAPFAPHMIEEYTENELRDIQLREKENSFLRRAEEDAIKDDRKLLRKYAQENVQLKKQLETVASFNITPPTDTTFTIPTYEKAGQDINIYLADMHIGATIVSGSFYKENVDYGEEEVRRRLQVCIDKLAEIGPFDKINLVLMGDNVDCCGHTGYTARMDHLMPENMDAMKQCEVFLKVTMDFINALVAGSLCSNLSVYSVPSGNHAGMFEYACNNALMNSIKAIYSNVYAEVWREYYGTFTVGEHIYICMHGKEDKFMKKPMPLNLDDRTKVLLYEWLEEKNIHGSNIHFIKGDLHSNALSSCKRLDYRNVLSLYGSSDYSNFNYSRNAYGISYDLMIRGNLVRGTFENM